MDARDRQNLAVAAVVIVLILAGVWLMNAMRRHGLVEDCLMARRRNCDPLLER
jgi:uncharacterized membrane protein YjjP (DUF1212 family)